MIGCMAFPDSAVRPLKISNIAVLTKTPKTPSPRANIQARKAIVSPGHGHYVTPPTTKYIRIPSAILVLYTMGPTCCQRCTELRSDIDYLSDLVLRGRCSNIRLAPLVPRGICCMIMSS